MNIVEWIFNQITRYYQLLRNTKVVGISILTFIIGTRMMGLLIDWYKSILGWKIRGSKVGDEIRSDKN